MGILNDTLLDALRPLPPTGGWVRRSLDPSTEAAPVEPEAIPEDSGALTLYRLQKDGGGGLPAVPSDPRAGDAGMFAHGPLPAPAVNPKGHDASPRVTGWMSERPEGKTPFDARDRPERDLSAAAIQSAEGAGSSAMASVTRRAPEALDRLSTPVEPDQVEDNARRGRETTLPAGRGTPSGGPTATGAHRQGPPPLRASPGPPAGHPTGSLPESAWGVDSPPSRPSATASPLAQDGGAGGQAPPPASAPPGPAARGPTEGGALAPPEALIEGHPGPGRAPSALAQPPPPSGPLMAEGSGPRLHIGRIEVLVVAPAKTEQKPPAWREEGFLSRNYLRRL